MRSDVVLIGDAAQLRNAADVDDGRRRGEPQLQQRNQAVAAGEELRARMRGQQLLRLARASGAAVSNRNPREYMSRSLPRV